MEDTRPSPREERKGQLGSLKDNRVLLNGGTGEEVVCVW
jgi:hypothetical protein